MAGLTPAKFHVERVHARLRRQRLNQIMENRRLTSGAIGRILNRTPEHVRAWRCGTAPMPPEMLRLLELELERLQSTAEGV
jgi:hypothetical protein